MNNHVLPVTTVASTEKTTATNLKKPLQDRGFSDSLREAETEAKVHDVDKNNKALAASHEDKQIHEKPAAKIAQSDHITTSNSIAGNEEVIAEPEIGLVADTALFAVDKLDASDIIDQITILVGEQNVPGDIQDALTSIMNQLQKILEEEGVGALTSAIEPQALSKSINAMIGIDIDELSLSTIVTSINTVLDKHLSVHHNLPVLMKTFSAEVDPITTNAAAKFNIQQGFSSQSVIDVQGSSAIGATGSTSQSLLPNGLLDRIQFSEKLVTQMADVTSDGKYLDADLLNQRTISDSPLLPVSSQQQLSSGLKPQLSVIIPFQQSSQWGQAVAERVVWMSGQDIQEAEIHLDPPELGPMQVKVSVVNEQAHVSFVVQHSTVREALDQSAMRLRELFDGEGINLVDVDVSDQSQQQDSDNPERAARVTSSESDEVTESEIALSLTHNGYSLVNTYV